MQRRWIGLFSQLPNLFWELKEWRHPPLHHRLWHPTALQHQWVRPGHQQRRPHLHRLRSRLRQQSMASRYDHRTTQGSRHGGKGGKSPNWAMESQHGYGNWQISSSKGGFDGAQRSQRAAPPCLAQTFRKVGGYLARVPRCLQETARALRAEPHQESQPGHPGCGNQHGRSGKSQPSDHPSRSGRGSHSCLGSQGSRENKTGRISPSQSDRHPEGMHRSYQRRSNDRCGGGGIRQATAKKSEISRSWGNASWLLILGNTLSCLRSAVCEPGPPIVPFKHVTFHDVEAYNGLERAPLDSAPCAACIPRHCHGNSIFHSILLEDDCCFEFNAIHNAAQLEKECQLFERDYAEWALDPYGPSPLQADGGKGHNVDPLSDKLAVSIHCDPTSHYIWDHDSNQETGSGFEIPGDEAAGLIPHLPTIPLQQQPEWIQDLFTTWSRTAGEIDESTTIHIRSWYLNPFRYMTSEVWRPIQLPPTTDYWFNSIRAVWHDMLEHDQAIDAFIVHPDPRRPTDNEHFFADLILCQQIDELPYHRPTLTVTQLIGEQYVRLHSRASLIPHEVSKWFLIYLNGNERFCAGPSFPVDFHRLCQARRGQQPILAQPIPVNFGDCFTIDIFPPTQIMPEEIDDIVNFMGRNPVLIREDYNPPPQQVEDRESTPSEASAQGPQHTRWFRTIVFTRDKEGIVGRISEGTLNHLYNQVAWMLETTEHSLLTLHEIRHPPADIEFYDYIWIAHRIDDVPPGSRSKLVLIDVEFCSNLPRLDSETIRMVKLLSSPITRTTLLQLLGVAPYCNSWSCLVKINNDFVPQTAPIAVAHGDWLQVILAPPGPCTTLPTRLVALGLHHGLQPHDIIHLQRQLPDGFDLEQMPNPDVELTALEFDYPRLELLQLSTTISNNEIERPAKPALECRLEDFEEIREQIAQHRANANLHDENVLLEQLANLPTALRDLHGLWLRIATRWLDEQFWAPVLVWYVSHRHYRICEAPQIAWLSENVESWEDEIRNAWRPFFDDEAGEEIVLVMPQPPDLEAGITAHILLVQHREAEQEAQEAAAVVALRDDGHPQNLVEKQAMVLPLRVTHELLLNVANRLTACLNNRALQCDTSFGAFQLNNEPMIGRTGLLYEVNIHRNGQMQLLPNQIHGILPETISTAAPNFVRDLHQAIRVQSRMEPELPVNLKVTTWFLNHERYHQCEYGRDVVLTPNPHHWLAQILQYWTDIYDQNFEVEVFFIRPRPSTTKWQIDINFHLLLHQQPLPHLRSVLITTFDESRGNPDPPGIHRAFALQHPAVAGSVARAIGCPDWHLAADRHCYISCGPTPIIGSPGFNSEHGHSLRVLLSAHPLPQWQSTYQSPAWSSSAPRPPQLWEGSPQPYHWREQWTKWASRSTNAGCHLVHWPAEAPDSTTA